jgi:hypothetical protein
MTAQRKKKASKKMAINRAPDAIVKAQPGIPKLTKSFIRSAEAADAGIQNMLTAYNISITRLKSEFSITLGEKCREFQANAYHVALGFPVFSDWARNRFQRSPAQIFEGMRIVGELTAGDKPILAREDAVQITQENAKELIRMKDHGARITPGVIEKAKGMTKKEFKLQVVEPALHRHPSNPIESKGEVQPAPERQVARLNEMFGVDTIKEYGEVMEIAMHFAKEPDKADIDPDTPLREQGFRAILAEYRSTYEAQFRQEQGLQAEADATRAEDVSHEQEYVSDELNIGDEEFVDEELPTT